MRTGSSRRIGLTTALVTLLLAAGLGSVTAAVPDPAQVGSWSGGDPARHHRHPCGARCRLGQRSVLRASRGVRWRAHGLFNPSHGQRHRCRSAPRRGACSARGCRSCQTVGFSPRAASRPAPREHPVGTGNQNAAIFDPATQELVGGPAHGEPKVVPVERGDARRHDPRDGGRDSSRRAPTRWSSRWSPTTRQDELVDHAAGHRPTSRGCTLARCCCRTATSLKQDPSERPASTTPPRSAGPRSRR